jgi:peptidoglycan/LPS O-acetylase OafA/YrhL
LLSLDILRAVAVLLVIGHHVQIGTDAPAILQAWHLGGWIGVDLFFVLSGFLVSGLLFREQMRHGTVRIGRFLVRRGLKIYPAFYCFLLATGAIMTLSKGFPPRQQVLGEVLFLQNYLGGVWNHTWSLAVEEHFYIGIALLVAAFARQRTDNPFHGMIVVLIGLAAVALAGRLALTTLPYASLTHLYPTHLRADSLGFGVILSYFYHFHHDRFVSVLKPMRHGLLLAGIVCLSPPFVWNLGQTPWLQTFGLTLLYLGSGMVLTGLLLCEAPSSLPWRIVGQVGAHSYSCYLWHMPVIVWGIPFVESRMGMSADPWIRLSLAIAGSVTVGIVAARLIEMPVLRVRDRFYPSPALTERKATGPQPVCIRFPLRAEMCEAGTEYS